MINPDDVARVRQGADLVQIASALTGLKKVGRRWTGLCPFHAEKTPSFSINAEDGLYYCHGCQAKGDVITFVRETEHLDFTAAVERLAEKMGIELHFDSEAAGHERKRKQTLIAAMEKAVDWYHQRLLSAPDAARARGYLRERGLNGDIVRRFRIGWAPEGWDELSRALQLPEAVLTETGLGFVNRRGRRQDAFRGRILFPIFDASGAPVAFGGRILPGAEGPKYKNSAETSIYVKSRTLYGLNWAKEQVVNRNEVIVCEGYTDVIGCFTAGMERAVATCGTALTEEHVRQMRNFASRIVLAYDADNAGQSAAERFYEWERKLGIEIAVAAFPGGKDPGDLARTNPERLADAIQNAQPFLGFRINRLIERSDLRSPEGRARAAEACLTMIAEHPSDLLRDQYLMIVADRCSVSIDRLRGGLAARLRGGAPAPSRAVVNERPVVDLRERDAASSSGSVRSEREALRVAVQKPEETAALLSRILPEGVVHLEEILFIDPSCREAFHSLTNSSTLHEAIETAVPEASELLTQLAVEDGGEDAGVDALIRLIDRAAGRQIRVFESAVRMQADNWQEAGASVGWLKLQVERLRNRETADAAASDLLGWMNSRLDEPVPQ